MSRNQEWLESLDSDVRAEVEAEIAFYKNEDLWEFEAVDDNDADGHRPLKLTLRCQPSPTLLPRRTDDDSSVTSA